MKFKHILMAMAVPTLAFLASCGGETANPSPSISLTAGAGLVSADINIQSDSILKFSVAATAGSENLSKITVTSSKNGAAATTLQDTSVSGKTANYVLSKMIAGSVGDVIKVLFTATDANGKTAETAVNITVVPATVPLVGFQNQKVWNSLNLNYGNAYDLESTFEVLPSVLDKTKKDLLDMTAASDAQFSKAWTSGNGSKFVKLTLNDFNIANTTTFLYNLWKANAANATDKVTGIAKDDVYLVKSGQNLPFNLYIIKITKVEDIPTIGNHNDYIEFSYKKITD
jgi:hypothetical protein